MLRRFPPRRWPGLGCLRAPLSGGPGPGQGPVGVDFTNTREAYRSKSSAEILRSLVVFKLCSYSLIVDRQRELLKLSRALLGKRLYTKLMKMTFYGQFVAGEDHKDIQPLIARNQAFGVGSILDYSVEEDLSHEEAETKEMESCESPTEKEIPAIRPREKKFQADRRFGDRRDTVVSARTYFYADENKCDQYMETFLQCIEASGRSSKDGFSAIKLTALGRPQFLLQFSEVLLKWQQFFHLLAEEQGKGGLAALEMTLELEQLQDNLMKLGLASEDEIIKWITGENLGQSGTVDLLDWNKLIDNRTKITELFLVPNLKSGLIEPLLSRFTKVEESQMKRMLQRMDVLAKKALASGVCLMVDAEQTYFQPAISRLTLEMQRKFNLDKPIIFNTYQCYLKEAYNNVTLDMELSRREGWCFGAKLVRGAYMVQERKRSSEIGYQDPINDSYEATTAMFNKSLNYILEEIKFTRKPRVMVASHNEETVRFTLSRMQELNLEPSERKVYFGQLLGMCDHLSFPLGQAGYPVYKYMPYGPVDDVLPYLSRRAQENKSVMGGSHLEQTLLWKEMKRRILNREVFYQPVF